MAENCCLGCEEVWANWSFQDGLSWIDCDDTACAEIEALHRDGQVNVYITDTALILACV